MKYKFIGTEQDLIDNGFEKSQIMPQTYIKEVKLRKLEIVVILIDGENLIFNSYEKLNDDLGLKQSDIQDLIDKGLVVEV